MSATKDAAASAVLDRALVVRLASLARLDVTAEEAERLTAELGKVLAYVEVLKELDGAPAPPPAAAARPAWRDDEPAPGLDHDTALGEAPRAAEGGFAVPRFVDEG